MNIALSVLLMALASQGHTAASPTAPVTLGILEDVPEEWGARGTRGLRILFERTGDGWRTVPACDRLPCKSGAPARWTIAFDGKAVGQVTSTPRVTTTYGAAGVQSVDGNGPIPTIGKRTHEFDGWAGGPVYRPLVAITRPNLEDPDGWRPRRPTPKLAAALRRAFHKAYPVVSNCPDASHPPRAWAYRDENIRIDKTYSSARGGSLAQVKLETYRCDGPEGDGSAFDVTVFVVDPAGRIEVLAHDRIFVDAGDYDADGRSELIFEISGYNSGGYELFYDDFRRHARFEFSDH